MANRQKVWIDGERCTGCGVCVEVCPVGAITLLDGRAHVDEAACTGCGACLGVCPEDAIQPVVEGELVTATPRHVPAVQQARPLVETAAPVVAVAGASLLARAAGALARAMGSWLAQASDNAPVVPGDERPVSDMPRGNAGARRMRRRRRGR